MAMKRNFCIIRLVSSVLPLATLFALVIAPATAAGAASGPEENKLVSWQGGNDRRGTWDIIISCLVTIFACTWSIQHLNIPAEQHSRVEPAQKFWASSWHTFLTTIWYPFWRELKWMIVTVLFPEIIVIHAYLEFTMALKALQDMEKSHKAVLRPWWLQRPSMKFLTASFTKAEDSASVETKPATVDIDDDKKWTIIHCFFANMGGLHLVAKDKSFPLTAVQLAAERGFEYPEILEADIRDKSKRDFFAKLVASLQILSLVLSIIVRKIRGLAYSQLETITLVFAVCGIVIYCLYFYKPQKVDRRMYLLAENRQEAAISSHQPFLRAISRKASQMNSIDSPTDLQPLEFRRTYDSLLDVLMNKSQLSKSNLGGPGAHIPDRIPNDNIPLSRNHVAHSAVGLLALASGLFGALHGIAWYAEFPTKVERYLWRTATCVGAGSPFFGLVSIPLTQLTTSAGDPKAFAANCLRLIREYSWYSTDEDKDLVREMQEKLEDILTPPEGPAFHYHRVFSQRGEVGEDLRKLDLAGKLLELLELRGEFASIKRYPDDLHSDQDFVQNFRRLVSILERNESKRLYDQATTVVYPQKDLLPKKINRIIVVSTCILYFLSRLSLLAVGFSSLRLMPKSVYVSTPWTSFIPSVGSGG